MKTFTNLKLGLVALATAVTNNSLAGPVNLECPYEIQNPNTGEVRKTLLTVSFDESSKTTEVNEKKHPGTVDESRIEIHIEGALLIINRRSGEFGFGIPRSGNAYDYVKIGVCRPAGQKKF